MKKLAILFASMFIMAIAVQNVNAQVSASAASEATIIAPIAIEKTEDLNFGNIAVHPTNDGTVELSPEGIRTPDGGVTLPAVQGTVTAASFTVTGDGDRTFTIGLPTNAITLTGSAGGTMELGAFTSTPSGIGTLENNTRVVTVGGTLTVGAAQTAGVYSNNDGLVVTVNYN